MRRRRKGCQLRGPTWASVWPRFSIRRPPRREPSLQRPSVAITAGTVARASSNRAKSIPHCYLPRTQAPNSTFCSSDRLLCRLWTVTMSLVGALPPLRPRPGALHCHVCWYQDTGTDTISVSWSCSCSCVVCLAQNRTSQPTCCETLCLY